MIITKLQGGLANQLFQWAYGKSLSEKYKTPSYLDLSFYQNQIGVTNREFSLNKFPNIKYQILNTKSDKKTLIVNDVFNFSLLNYNDNYNYYLNGYWQSQKYFIEIERLIREELKPCESNINKLEEKYPTKKSVSIHIRRTDYVTSNGYHPVQPVEYYKRAIEIIGNYENILVFSDDIKWCKENLQFDNMKFVEGNDDVEDLWLMSLCDHNIIANSSFSWWGAWLNENPKKMVIAPKNWFGDQTKLDTKDLIPNSWIKI